MNDSISVIRSNIKRLLKARNVTVKQIAQATKLSESTIGYLVYYDEKTSHNPKFMTVKLVAEFFDLTVDDLLDRNLFERPLRQTYKVDETEYQMVQKIRDLKEPYRETVNNLLVDLLKLQQEADEQTRLQTEQFVTSLALQYESANIPVDRQQLEEALERAQAGIEAPR